MTLNKNYRVDVRRMSFLETVISLIVLRCDRYLSSRGIQDSLKDFPSLSEVVSRLTNPDLERWAHVMERLDSEDVAAAHPKLSEAEAKDRFPFARHI